MWRWKTETLADDVYPSSLGWCREIRQYQSGKDAYRLLIPRLPFWRYAREVLSNMKPNDDFRWSVAGVTALQEAVEAFLVGMFEDALVCTLHAKRVTLMVKDMHLARRMRGENMQDFVPREYFP